MGSRVQGFKGSSEEVRKWGSLEVRKRESQKQHEKLAQKIVELKHP